MAYGWSLRKSHFGHGDRTTIRPPPNDDVPGGREELLPRLRTARWYGQRGVTEPDHVIDGANISAVGASASSSEPVTQLFVARGATSYSVAIH